MTKDPSVERRGVDAVIDETLAAMTSVEAFEARTLASLHQRLRDEAPQPLAVRSIAFRPAFALTLAVVATVLVVAGTTLLDWPRSSERKLAQQDRTMPTSAPAAPIATRPATPERRVASAPDVTGSSAVSPVTRRATRSTGVPQRRVASNQPQPDRLVAFLHAIQQLPPDVWERLDRAGPPAVPALDVGEASGLSPITVAPLPSAEWPAADTAADPNPSGGYR